MVIISKLVLSEVQMKKLYSIQGAADRKCLVRDFYAREETNCVGRASLFIFHTRTRIYAEIHDVFVEEWARRRGHGTLLVSDVIEHVRQYAEHERQVVYLQLTSGPKRVEANKLYIKLGFTLAAAATDEKGTNFYRLMCNPE